MDELFEFMVVRQKQEELQKVIKCNEKTAAYGLSLSEEEAGALMEGRENSLKESQRVEFGEGILPDIITAFCDSTYLNQDEYSDTLSRLQDIFYSFKNECMDELTDGELLDFMRQQFDEICFGDLDYLAGTCLERFTRAVRKGYWARAQKRPRDEYAMNRHGDEYGQFSEETRWEFELYRTKLEDMD